MAGSLYFGSKSVAIATPVVSTKAGNTIYSFVSEPDASGKIPTLKPTELVIDPNATTVTSGDSILPPLGINHDK